MYREERKKLNDNIVNIIAFISYKFKLYTTINNFTGLKCGNLYYFKITKEHVLLKHMYNKYILCRLTSVFPKKSTYNKWLPVDGNEISQYSTVYEFEYIKCEDTEEKIKSLSYLKGFNNVIKDSYYYSAIPMVNEITHWDNGIKSFIDSLIDYKIGNNWDDFEINFDTIIDEDNYIKIMVNEDHENPER